MLRIHSFESMGTFDGPGLRLVVFLQGCNFQCLYCANPDTIPIGKGGKLIEEAEVLRRAISERPFFGKRGGITFSGGEPTVQAQALITSLIVQLQGSRGYHICLDTQGSIRAMLMWMSSSRSSIWSCLTASMSYPKGIVA